MDPSEKQWIRALRGVDRTRPRIGMLASSISSRSRPSSVGPIKQGSQALNRKRWRWAVGARENEDPGGDVSWHMAHEDDRVLDWLHDSTDHLESRYPAFL